MAKRNRRPRERTLPRQQRKRQTRAALKRAALHCFAQSGIEATAIAAINAQAGVAHGTFYVHFPDKTALLRELLDDFNATYLQRIAPLFARRSPQLESLIGRLVDATLAHFSAHPLHLQVFVHRMTAGGSERDLGEGVNPGAVALLASLLAEAYGWAAADAEWAVQGLMALWMRLLLRRHSHPGAMPRARLRRLLVRLTVGAVRGIAQEQSR